jgi:hypothetical protein
VGDISSCQVVGFKGIGIHVKASLHGGDPAIDNKSHGNSAESHADEFYKGNRRIGEFGSQPSPEKIDKYNHQYEPYEKSQAENDVEKKLRNHDLK